MPVLGGAGKRPSAPPPPVTLWAALHKPQCVGTQVTYSVHQAASLGVALACLSARSDPPLLTPVLSPWPSVNRRGCRWEVMEGQPAAALGMLALAPSIPAT